MRCNDSSPDSESGLQSNRLVGRVAERGLLAIKARSPIYMKIILFTPMVALLLASAGCTSLNSSRNDEAKVVARILAQSASSPLAFGDQTGAQQLLSTLDTSEHFTFGVILDAKKKVFASYSRPDQISEKQKFLARVVESVPTDTPETLTMGDGVAIAMVRVGVKEETIGYVAVARKTQ